MDIKILKQAEKQFFEMYPGGFANPELQEMSKRHKPFKMTKMAQTAFTKSNFADPQDIVSNMIKITSKSSMVSLFEKPKFRDFAKSFSAKQQENMAKGLKAFLYGDQERGFDLLVDTLQDAKLAKWTLITVCPFYFNPQVEVFMKPTTVKGTIEYFNLEGLKYSATPTYQFYKAYREAFNEMKTHVSPLLSPDNGHFSGFLMISMGI